MKQFRKERFKQIKELYGTNHRCTRYIALKHQNQRHTAAAGTNSKCATCVLGQ